MISLGRGGLSCGVKYQRERAGASESGGQVQRKPQASGLLGMSLVLQG